MEFLCHGSMFLQKRVICELKYKEICFLLILCVLEWLVPYNNFWSGAVLGHGTSWCLRRRRRRRRGRRRRGRRRRGRRRGGRRRRHLGQQLCPLRHELQCLDVGKINLFKGLSEGTPRTRSCPFAGPTDWQEYKPRLHRMHGRNKKTSRSVLCATRHTRCAPSEELR